jgi:hypothetical protein
MQKSSCYVAIDLMDECVRRSKVTLGEGRLDTVARVNLLRAL